MLSVFLKKKNIWCFRCEIMALASVELTVAMCSRDFIVAIMPKLLTPKVWDLVCTLPKLLSTNIMAAFARTTQAVLGVAITYKQATTGRTQRLTATVGKPDFAIDDGSGGAIIWEGRDYIFSAGDLTDISGDVYEPQRGDTITETSGKVYRVSVPGNMNVFESIGPDSSVLKIHTKAV